MQSNRDRIKEMIEHISTFNDADPGEGISRFSYSENDAKARKYLIDICEDIGLKVRVDAVGNVFARLVGTDESLPVVMSGSHIDSVKNGGDVYKRQAKDKFGSLKAGLQVPDKPQAEATVSKGGVKLTWKAPKAEQNKPLPTSYKAVVYDKDGKAVTEATCDGTTTSLQLDVNTSQTYTIKFWVISPVGRSDMQTLTTAAYDLSLIHI